MPSSERDLSNPIQVLFVSTFSEKHGAAIGESLGAEVLQDIYWESLENW